VPGRDRLRSSSGANQSRLGPETGSNPDWFGPRPLPSPARGPTAPDSLASMMQLSAAQRRETEAETYADSHSAGKTPAGVDPAHSPNSPIA